MAKAVDMGMDMVKVMVKVTATKGPLMKILLVLFTSATARQYSVNYQCLYAARESGICTLLVRLRAQTVSSQSHVLLPMASPSALSHASLFDNNTLLQRAPISLRLLSPMERHHPVACNHH
ncbi:hypothetical protein TrVGV298_000511 [Trichoderma virens]|nr:hypothetical protein TrVGV298_000511 [Trichoderma virens]